MPQGADVRGTDRRGLWLRMTWVASFVPLVVYIGMANVIGREGSITGGDPDEIFNLVKYILYGIAALLLPLALVLRKATLNQHSAIMRFTASWSPITRYVGLLVAAGGMCEAVAIYGLIVFMLDGDFVSLYALIGLSAASLAYLWPRRRDLVDQGSSPKRWRSDCE